MPYMIVKLQMKQPCQRVLARTVRVGGSRGIRTPSGCGSCDGRKRLERLQYSYIYFLCNCHTGPVVKKTIYGIGALCLLVGVFSTIFVFAQSSAQGCVTDIISEQIRQLGIHGGNATAPLEVVELMDRCESGFLASAALSLGFSSVMAAVLGAILSNRLRAGQSTRVSADVSAHYEHDTRKLVLRFDRPTIAQNPQRMVLLCHHADGMATAVPGQQCGNSGLTLAFTTDIEKPPTHMELVICSGAMHPAGFPESDVCADGRLIHIDVDILHCNT